jgi:formylglycine-generating enzyme required for sulfatase activity/transposase-like protein
MANPRQHFDDNQKLALVQLMLTGGLSLQQAATLYGLTTDQLRDWVCQFRRAVRRALDQKLRDALSARGLELDEIAPAELSGSLADIAIDDLLQTIQMGRKNARITVMHAGGSSEIWCQAGEVIDARSGSLEGEKALYRILAIERGDVVADFAADEHPRRIELPLQRLLLEAASSTGLRARLMQRIGDPTSVFAVDRDRAAAQAAAFEADEGELLEQFDGVRSVEEIILSSGMPDARALEVIAHLREQQVLVASAPRAGPSAPDSAPPSSHVTMSYGPLVARVGAEAARLPAWCLACGALFFSALGAVAALAYATADGRAAPSPVLAPAPEAAAPGPQPGADVHRVPEPAAGASAMSALPSVPSSDLGSKAPNCPAHMVWIEGGQFTMGSNSKRPALSLARPAHVVRVDGFCLDMREVTVRRYTECSEAGDCAPAHQTAHFAAEAGMVDESTESVASHGLLCNTGKRGFEEHPINCISHAAAAGFCQARGARLPTEAEWEFAARGSSSRSYPWGDAKPTRAHLNACGQECTRWHAERGVDADVHESMYLGSDGFAGTAPAGSFPLGATPEGVLDLVGNVFEWTAHGLYDYGRDERANPRGPSDSDSFVIRGGNFNSGLREFADPALRFGMHGESYSHGVGFRCAAEPRTDGTSGMGY